MIYAFCGHSGSGKTTIANILSRETGIKLISSYTTRPRRPKETHGIDYYFIDNNIFDKLKNDNIIIADCSYKVANGGLWKYGFDKRLFQDVDNKDYIVVLTPEGVEDLKNLGYEVTSVLIEVNIDSRLERIGKRKDNQGKEEIERRLKADKKDFEGFKPDYIVDNSGDMKSTLNVVKNIF